MNKKLKVFILFLVVIGGISIFVWNQIKFSNNIESNIKNKKEVSINNINEKIAKRGYLFNQIEFNKLDRFIIKVYNNKNDTFLYNYLDMKNNINNSLVLLYFLMLGPEFFDFNYTFDRCYYIINKLENNKNNVIIIKTKTFYFRNFIEINNVTDFLIKTIIPELGKNKINNYYYTLMKEITINCSNRLQIT